ncbi:MAG: hypothetical protein ABI232_11880, partial [Jatrophihabitantaceae bacterium]
MTLIDQSAQQAPGGHAIQAGELSDSLVGDRLVGRDLEDYLLVGAIRAEGAEGVVRPSPSSVLNDDAGIPESLEARTCIGAVDSEH